MFCVRLCACVRVSPHRYRPYVSVTSMIAPSPDWFVGVDTLDLCDDSSWVNEVVRPAFPYDAGQFLCRLFHYSNQEYSRCRHCHTTLRRCRVFKIITAVKYR